jgi:DNA-binding SARP family transcriptional activator
VQHATNLAPAADLEHEVFAQIPLGLVVLDARRTVLDANDAARELVGAALPREGRRTCCDVFGCRAEGPLRDVCLTDLALASADAPADLRVELAAGATWVSAAPLGPRGERAVVILRPAVAGDRRRRQEPWCEERGLRICVLGATAVRGPGGPLDGTWLSQRAGQVLKYLVCHRDRAIHVEELADAFWPEAGMTAVSTVRHFIHALRDRLEPGRTKGRPSPFVVTRDGGYRLDLQRVSIDVIEFEEHLAAGRLERALALYRGDMLADEPYADWAFGERERVRALAAGALRALAERAAAQGDLETAAERWQQLVEMEPFAVDAQRELIGLCLRRRRHDEALRRYTVLRQRMRRQFGEEPGFTLAELSA